MKKTINARTIADFMFKEARYKKVQGMTIESRVLIQLALDRFKGRIPYGIVDRKLCYMAIDFMLNEMGCKMQFPEKEGTGTLIIIP